MVVTLSAIVTYWVTHHLWLLLDEEHTIADVMATNSSRNDGFSYYSRDNPGHPLPESGIFRSLDDILRPNHKYVQVAQFGILEHEIETVRSEKLKSGLQLPPQITNGFDFSKLGTIRYVDFLQIHSPRFDDAQCVHLRGLMYLHAVDFDFTSITGEGLDNIPCPEKVTDLFVSIPTWTDSDLAHVKRFINLRGLILCGTQVSFQGLRQLSSLSKLQDLGLDHCPNLKQGNGGVRDLCELKKLHLVSMDSFGLTEEDRDEIKLHEDDIKFVIDRIWIRPPKDNN